MKGIRILIVEDELINAYSLKSDLGKYSYKECAIATNCKDALDAVEKSLPHFILMDINLNNHQDGIELAKEIYEKHRIPFAYVSGFLDKHSVERMNAGSPSGIFSKPANVKSIVKLIEKTLNLRP